MGCYRKDAIKKNEAQRLQEKSQNEASEIGKKYLLTKSIGFKSIIVLIYKDKEQLVEKENLNLLKENIIELNKQTKKNTPSNPDEYDEVMLMENTCNDALQYIQDLEKIKKILEKRGFKLDYSKLVKLMADLVNEDIKKSMGELTIPVYDLISKITTNKKQIVKEYLKLGFDNRANEMIIQDLFDKFGFSYSIEEVTKLLGQCLEDKELEDFEKNLGIKQQKHIGDFDSLNGHQFENYLKELFLSLGYQVIRTKLSRDQGADLIIKKDDEKTVVQAKKYSGQVGNKAIQEIVASKKYYGAEKAMVVTTGVFTKSAMELAKSNKVELWDKNRLEESISEINKSFDKNRRLESDQSAIIDANYLFTLKNRLKESISEINKSSDKNRWLESEQSAIMDTDYLFTLINSLEELSSKMDKYINTDSWLKSKQSVSINDEYASTFCQFCESKIMLKTNDLPKIKTQKKMICPECRFDVEISIPEKVYSCVGCKKEFETVKEVIEHSKQCIKAKEREFNCSHCKKEFTLNDTEFAEFIKKSYLKIKCSECKKSNILKK
ncbi:MAG: restriction endonuclease [Desulfobacula sp.]|nr:restriction endonuclease [Desulfobacula sp.]